MEMGLCLVDPGETGMHATETEWDQAGSLLVMLV